MQWITADKIHDGKDWMPENTFLKIDIDGTILAIQQEAPKEPSIHYKGWICPGFINVHCHLELSHMKGLIPKGTGLVAFVQAIVNNRQESAIEEKLQKIQETILCSHTKGIVAFGDICNTTDTIPVKKESSIYFHSFIESLGKIPERAEAAFSFTENTFLEFGKQLKEHNYKQSIVPHAPYSVSEALYEKINCTDPNAILSIHSQETRAEEELFISGTGPMLSFFTTIGIPLECATAKGVNSLQWILRQTADTHPLILVHNTFIEKVDVEKVKSRNGETYFCICPNANIYIENTLPPVTMLHEEGMAICIGTDSLASNDDICIFSELKTIHHHFRDIPWHTLLRWATYNGAIALGIDNEMGALEIGKKPGLVHLDADLQYSQLVDFASLK